MAPQKLIIDTDPGVDDAMAILFACAHPELELVGLTSIFGNVTIDVATRNALVLSELAKVNVPVAEGAAGPLVQTPRPVAAEVHGAEGFGHVPPITPAGAPDGRSAAEFICDMVSAHPGEIVLCPIGPLTNLAEALKRDPEIASKVKSVTVMGGSVWAGGNATPHAEANIWQDPHAAEEVFAAPWPITLVGLDVTHDVICTNAQFADLAKAAPTHGGFLNEISQFYFRFHDEVDGFLGCYMHDPSAVISILHPELFTSTQHPVKVVLEGDEAGRTLIAEEGGRPAINVCRKVDADGVKQVFLSTVAAAG
ncbi:MAG: nucleoside hydrolase [Pseudomonadota bacterium]